MAFRIGFMADHTERQKQSEAVLAAGMPTEPRKSVVQVRFPGRGAALAYYNDQFDLHRGDLVYVDGKLEGIRGTVVDVAYNFKIKVSEYKRVIALVDTNVTGELFMAGSHFMTFDPNVLPHSKIVNWFKAPVQNPDDYVSSTDDTGFSLDTLDGLKVSNAIGERGNNYYLENRVRYICMDGTHGKAIVEGTQAYEVEFEYQDGQICNLICDCFCTYHCKHEVAAMLQLRETLALIEKHYREQFRKSKYFAAVCKTTLFQIAVSGKETGSITL